MKITALRLHNVKRFAGRGVAIEGIGEGVNVLCAANEFGKSTSFEALHALFFLPHSSQSNDVKALRPYAGGSPLVEADIATEKGRFRISKQFHGGRAARVSDLATGRLLAQADEAENFIAALVRGGTAGPAGLLWVRQGVTGIEQRSRSEEDREKQIRAGLLESVQGEVEAVTGGRRMADIIARVQATLGELVTATGRPKTGGRYEAAIRERDALRERETKLGTDVEALRAFLDQREAAARKLAELDREEDRAERRASIQRAQAEFDAAKAQSERLRAAQAELRLARERRDGAERELTGFRAALAASVRLAADLEAAERTGHEAVERRAQAAAAAEAARLAGEAAEREETQARALLARHQAALRAREAAERLSERSERLAKAESAQRLIEERTARLAHLKIPARAVDELQALEIEIVRLRAAAEAAQPSVAIAYEPGAAVRVVMDGATLEETAPRGYEAKAELIVPGVGTLTLRSNRVEGGRAAIGQAEGRRRVSLETLDVASLAQARERQSAAERAEGEIRQAEAELKLLAPEGLAELRETIAAHRPVDGNDLELLGDPDAAALALEAAETRRREAHEAGRAAVPLQRRADDAFVEARAHLARIEAETAQVAATLGPAADRGSREDALAQGLREAEARFADAGRDAERLGEAGTDLTAREATLKRLVSVAEAAAKETQTLRDTLVGLNAQIEARAEEAIEESWRECGEALGAAEARVAAFDREVAVLQRLFTTLAEARSQARELYLRPVMAELKPLLGLLFADASIVFDEKTLLPHRIERGGVHEEVDRLSGGMREQLSVLTRLAFARLLAKDARPAPVILDDALVYSDDDRIEKMFDALHRQSSDQQIIVFSCRQRAFQRLGGNVLQMVEWVPSQS